MATSVLIHVVPVGGQWDIKRNGSPVATYHHKDYAVARARDLARRCAPSRLLIFRTDRTVEEESSFGEGPSSRAS